MMEEFIGIRPDGSVDRFDSNTAFNRSVRSGICYDECEARLDTTSVKMNLKKGSFSVDGQEHFQEQQHRVRVPKIIMQPIHLVIVNGKDMEMKEIPTNIRFIMTWNSPDGSDPVSCMVDQKEGVAKIKQGEF